MSPLTAGEGEVVLAGHTIMLEPLTLDHAPDLLQALNNDEEIWRYMPVEQPKTAAGDGSQRAPWYPGFASNFGTS
jgi:hypothetical protein